MLDKDNIYKSACNILKQAGGFGNYGGHNPAMKPLKNTQVASDPKSTQAPSAYKPMKDQPGTKIKSGDTIESLEAKKNQTPGQTIKKLKQNNQVS